MFSFDFSKTFYMMVSHEILCNKLKTYNINPYVINWIVNFLSDRQQRAVIGGVVYISSYLNINGGVP